MFGSLYRELIYTLNIDQIYKFIKWKLLLSVKIIILVTGKIQCMNQLFVYMTHIPTHLYHKVETNPPNIDENDGEACDVKKTKNKQELSTFGQYKVYYEVLRDLEQGGPNLILNDIYILLISIFFSYS